MTSILNSIIVPYEILIFVYEFNFNVCVHILPSTLNLIHKLKRLKYILLALNQGY